MNSKYHQTVVEIAINSMPSEFHKKFLDGFSIELLKEYADVPYVPAKFGEPEHLHLNHSFKLALRGCDLHRDCEGAALEELLKLNEGIKQLSSEGNEMLVRYSISKATHYIVDIATYSHVNAGAWDKYHVKFEELAAEWLVSHKHIIEQLVQNYTPNPMRSVQNRVRTMAEEAFFDSMELLPHFKRNAQISDLLMATMCCKHIYAIMDWFATNTKYLGGK